MLRCCLLQTHREVGVLRLDLGTMLLGEEHKARERLFGSALFGAL